jgi:hypothetical protein
MARPRSCQSRPAAHTRCLVPAFDGLELRLPSNTIIVSAPVVLTIVAPPQTRVADNVSSENRRQCAPLTGHGNFPRFLQWIVEGQGLLGNQWEEGGSAVCSQGVGKIQRNVIAPTASWV